MARKPAPIDDGRPKLIGLVRVSTERQGESGLGLEAQTAAIERYRASVNGVLLRTYTEIESGTHNDIDSRPKLKAAVADANLARARLVIAKFDRLVRSTVIMAYLKSSCKQFVACDNPYANELTIDILAAVAASEARSISTRTREALSAYKAGMRVSKRYHALYPSGVPADVAAATAGKLGASLPQCRNLTDDARRKGAAASSAKRSRAAKHAYDHLIDAMREFRAPASASGRSPIGSTSWATRPSRDARGRKGRSSESWTARNNSVGCLDMSRHPGYYTTMGRERRPTEARTQETTMTTATKSKTDCKVKIEWRIDGEYGYRWSRLRYIERWISKHGMKSIEMTTALTAETPLGDVIYGGDTGVHDADGTPLACPLADTLLQQFVRVVRRALEGRYSHAR